MDIKETWEYNESDGKVYRSKTMDVQQILDDNAAERASQNEHGQFLNRKSSLVKAATISMVDVERLQRLGYNLMSPDPEERKRAFLYIQSEEKHHLTVNGKPFAKKRQIWE
jgi:hypothetical protein